MGEARSCCREGKASPELGEGGSGLEEGREQKSVRSRRCLYWESGAEGEQSHRGWRQRQGRGRGRTVPERLREGELEEEEGRMR